MVFILHLHRVNVVRQSEMCTSEPLTAGPSDFETEIANKKIERYNHHIQVSIKFQQK
jgi:hypothetical protein